MKKVLLSIMVLLASYCYADDAYVLEVLTVERAPTTDLRVHGGGVGWLPGDNATEEQYNAKPRLKFVGIEPDGRKLFRGELPAGVKNSSDNLFIAGLYTPSEVFARSTPYSFSPDADGSPNTEGVTQRIEITGWNADTNDNLQLYLLNVNVKVPVAVTELYFLGPWGAVSEFNPIEQAVRELVLIETTANYKVFQLTMGRVTHKNKEDARILPKYEDFDFVKGKFLCGMDMQYIQNEATEFFYEGDGTDVGAEEDGAAGNIEFDLSTTGFKEIPGGASSLAKVDNSYYDIKVADRKIQVENANLVEIYNIQGILLASSTASSFVSEQLKSGVYLVVVDKNQVRKVILF